MVEIAVKKRVNVHLLIEKLFSNTAHGPSIQGTFADDHVRLHDDKTTYTGVHVAGGPTIIDNKLTLDMHKWIKRCGGGIPMR